MSGPAVLTPRARRELREALHEIGQNDLDAARSLNDAVVLASDRLGTNSNLGSSRPYLPRHLRAWALTRYRYLLIYDASRDPVQVLRMVHMARDLPRVLAALRNLPEP